MSGWIHGKGLTLTNLIHIAEALQVSLNWLVHGIGSEQLAANLAFNQLLRLSDEHITQAIQQEYTQWLPRHLHTPVRHLMKETLQNGHAGTKKIQITRNSNENSFFIIKSRMLDMPDIQAGCGVQMVFFPLEEK